MLQKAVEYIKRNLPLHNPETAVVLGSGLGGFAAEMSDVCALNYKDIPGFPQTTVSGHKGQLLHGYVQNKEVLCLNGRFHLYEGHKPSVIADIIHILKELGVKRLIVTNAAGGINTSFSVGDIMLIEDHINFMGKNPLVGANDETLGCRFPDMSFAYSPELRALAERCAGEIGTRLCKGVYLACSGPSYETPAEIRAFRTLGADAVGMSTVPEVIAANHCGMRVLAFSLISNMAAGILRQPLTEEEVLEAGRQKGAEMQRLIVEILRNL